MTTAILEKRTSESVLYDVNCSLLLDAGELVSGAPTIISDQLGLVFGAPIINSAPITYDDGTTAAIGKVIQVRISAGLIPSGTSQTYTVRVQFTTSTGNQREATLLLLVTDTPS